MTWQEPYGPLIGTGVRVLTWNVWGEEGPYAQRAGRIEKVVRGLAPDVVALQEWAGQRLGYEHVAAARRRRRSPCCPAGRSSGRRTGRCRAGRRRGEGRRAAGPRAVLRAGRAARAVTGAQRDDRGLPRMLTGRSATSVPGLVFYDAWEVAGDGGPGHTWSNANPWARPALYPDRRFDYVLSAWPRAGGAGHPVRCEVVGDGPEPASDHYGVLAELRY
ncbi:endonuclease/exonuclease/phosphatase family protein [Nonomuraea thailandensis]